MYKILTSFAQMVSLHLQSWLKSNEWKLCS